MDITFNKLPVEIVNSILILIFDTNTYLNCRLVCKDWYKYLKDIKNFKNNKVISITKFSDNLIETYNLENRIIREIILKKYGNYEINHYFYHRNKKKIRKKLIHTAPNKTEEINYNGEVIFMKTITDIKNNKIDTINYPYPFCAIS